MKGLGGRGQQEKEGAGLYGGGVLGLQEGLGSPLYPVQEGAAPSPSLSPSRPLFLRHRYKQWPRFNTASLSPHKNPTSLVDPRRRS